jgi:hypothetical protein
MSDKCKEAVGDDNDAWDGRRSVCLPLYTVSGDVRFTEYEEKDTAGYY